MITSIYRRSRPTGGFNLTPMIDVTFQLIIFFILAGAFASADRVELDVPTLAGTEHLEDLKLPDKVMVHIVPDLEADDGRVAYWQVAGVRIDPDETSAARLVDELMLARARFERRSEGGELQVEVRADKRVGYAQVEPVLVCIDRAGFRRVHYVAVGSEAQ